jgi:hypothetical protein
MEREDNSDPVSIVLLLREPHRYDKEELRVAAERAWGVSFEGVAGPDNFVIQSGHLALMKAGPHLLSLPNAPQPYLGDPRSISKKLPRRQRSAWMEHRAWAAVDHMNRRVEPDLQYRALARVVAEMLTANCVGVFIPAKGTFLPNDASLYDALRRFATDRDIEMTSQG